MNMKKTYQSRNSGSALVFAVFAVILLSVMGGTLLSLGFGSRSFAIRNAEQVQARSAADAGLTKALFEMDKKLQANDWANPSIPQAEDEVLPNCDATFSYKIVSNSINSNKNHTITSKGYSGEIVKEVSADIGLQGLFDYAIYGDTYVELKSQSVVDWYNYDDDDDEKPLKIGTNATGKDDLVLHNDCTVNGTLVVGLDGEPGNVIKLDTGASYTGEAYAATEIVELDPMTVPQWLQSLPSSGDITTPTTITTSGKYRKISLKNSKNLIIDGAVTLYVTDSIGLDTNGQIQITDTNPNSSLTLYVGGNFITNNGGLINNLTKDPKKLTIYALSTATKIEFKTDCEFYGTIYAPKTDLIMRNSVDIYGAVVGKTFIQYKAAEFMYDASLREVTANDDGVRFVVKRWRE